MGVLIILFSVHVFQVEKSTAPKPQEEFTGMMGNLAKALDERHKVMHSSGNMQASKLQNIV